MKRYKSLLKEETRQVTMIIYNMNDRKAYTEISKLLKKKGILDYASYQSAKEIRGYGATQSRGYWEIKGKETKLPWDEMNAILEKYHTNSSDIYDDEYRGKE